MVCFKAGFRHFLGGTDKNYEISGTGEAASRLIPGFPEHDAGMLTIQLRRSIMYG
jgi:hypothetical protein